MKYLILGLTALGLSACATVKEGTTQAITLTSNVEGAMCGIEQNGVQIVAPATVPAAHFIKRQDGNLIVTCMADGYETEKVALVTGKSPLAVAGSMVVGFAINAGFDAASGAWHESQNEAYVHLRKKSAL
jgi:hypothetical protein